MAKIPHILIFNPDQWRGDVLGHIGNPAAHTPHLDQLVAQEAVSLSNTFTQNPVSTPSRCSFMTGWYPHVRGHRTMHHMLHPDEPCLLKTLRDQGYYVWWGGKNDLIPAQLPLNAYCDQRFEPTSDDYQRWGCTPAPRIDPWGPWRGDPTGDNYYSFFRGRLDTDAKGRYFDHDWAVVRGVIDFIHRAPQDQPMCLFLALGNPHPPYAVEASWFNKIDRDCLPSRIATPATWIGKPAILQGIHERQRLQTWTEDRWSELRATYYGMCARVDHQLGLIVNALRDRGLWDDTAMFMFSDHGDFTGDYGLVEKTQNTFEDCLTRVPLVIKPPAGIPVQPRVCDALTELVDVSATIYELAGIEPNYTSFGRSLLKVVAGQTNLHRDAVFCEGGRLPGEAHASELHSVNDTKPTGLYWPRIGLQVTDEIAHTKAVMCRTSHYKYVRRLLEQDELYDLTADPAELHNRIDDPTLATAREELRNRMLTFFMETSDVVPHEVDRRW